MRVLLRDLAAMGKTLIVTSHILPELARICDTVAIITKGKMRAFGTQEEIMRDITQRRTIEIQVVDGGRAEEVRKLVVESLDELTSDDVSASSTEALVRFDTAIDDQALSSLLMHLMDKRMPISQFREVPTDLEDAFLSVTSKENEQTTSDNTVSVANNSETA
jgi:ABC-2 type transport system ATP-binding protein